MARLLKKGLESYSKTDAGKCFTYTWRLPAKLAGGDDTEQYLDCPMHEEPLLLIPLEARKEVLEGRSTKNCPMAASCGSMAMSAPSAGRSRPI